MDEIIITTPDQLKRIVKECLADLSQLSKPSTEVVPVKNIYSLKDLAAFLGCSIVTAQKLKNSGRIRYKQFGRKCVFNTSEVMEDLSKRRKG
jgi:hypothetical protein